MLQLVGYALLLLAAAWMEVVLRCDWWEPRATSLGLAAGAGVGLAGVACLVRELVRACRRPVPAREREEPRK